MSLFNSELAPVLAELLAVFGEDCTYNGEQITAIFEYEEIETEAGFQAIPTIQVDKSMNLDTTTGLPVFISGENFTVKRAIKDDSDLQIIELNRA